MSVFDGLSDIFVDVFGEGDQAVIYTPVSTGVAQPINAIWWEAPLDIVIGDNVAADGNRTQLHVRASDIPNPQEGDIAQRVRDSKVMIVTTPIHADGKGMIVCNLS